MRVRSRTSHRTSKYRWSCEKGRTSFLYPWGGGLELESASISASHFGARIPFVGEEVCERRQQTGAEPPALAVSLRDVVLLQQPGEERLREILRVMRAVSFAPDERVERISASPAQFGQCSIGPPVKPCRALPAPRSSAWWQRIR